MAAMTACHMALSPAASSASASTQASTNGLPHSTKSCQLACFSGRSQFVSRSSCQVAQRGQISIVRAQSAEADFSEDVSKTLLPPAHFYKVEAIIRPWRLQYVAQALLRMGIRGVTVTDVRGFGAQGGSRERQAGSEFTDDKFVSKVKVEVVVVYEQVEEVVACIIEDARTGEIGDGKIFVSPVSDVIRVRTGERGIQAERMAGGRMELLAAKTNGSS